MTNSSSNTKQRKISGTTRFHLDTYGYAQLGAINQGIKNHAMMEMYKSFTGEYDEVVAKTFHEAAMAEQHIRNKEIYDTTPENQREEGAKDPGQLNEYLARSLQAANKTTIMYAQKRIDMISDLTPTQVLDYHSDKEGKLPVNLSDALKKIMNSNTKKISELTEEDGIIANTITALDDYKVQGNINQRLQRSIAQRKISQLEASLQEA